MARQRGKRWMTDVRNGDTRLRYSFPTQEAAEAWEAATRKALIEGKPIPDPNGTTATAQATLKHNELRTMKGLLKFTFETEWKGTRAWDSTYKNGRDVTEFLGPDLDPNEVDHVMITQMRAHFLAKGLKPATVNNKCSALSKMLRIGEVAGVVARAPKVKKTSTKQTRFRYIDDAEEAAILAHWVKVDRVDLHDFTVLLVDTGARAYSEMARVTWKDILADYSSVTFWDTKTKWRTVPLTARCQEILKARRERFPKSAGPFVNAGFKMTKDNIRDPWLEMRYATKLLDVTPHTLRHTCCTRLVLGGVDIKRVMTWMGHNAIQTTMRYMQIREKALEEVVHVLERRAA